MRRLRFIALILAALTAAPGSASATSEPTFKFMLECRAPGPFEGYVTLYGADATGAVDYANVLGSWTCSDKNRTVQDELTLQVNDWANPNGFGSLEFRSTAFGEFGGCLWGFGIESLETPGWPGRGGAQFHCAPPVSSDEPHENIWMQALLFSAGDQPGYFGS